ncbi:hypothetical protein ABW20_dc0110160 [Dactylellina cionopaga]|nr:hypothetical protein ABW20_dc0110160 [Dactylellina cionopaga]
MQAAKQAVSEFLHHGNKHSVEIEQETKPVVLHERVTEKQHENVIHHGRFKDEQEILPVETTNAHNVVVGEHVHHHVHDYIQPVIERERVVPHVVHTTVPIHEHIEHEPYIHKGNVLPVMTLEEFTKKGFSFKGSKKPLEHIDYEGKPLEIDPESHVGFAKSGFEGTHRSEHEHGAGTGVMGAAGTAAATTAAAKAYTHSSKPKSSRHSTSSLSSSDEEKQSRVPRSMSNKEKKKGSSPRKHSWLDKLNPRVDTTQNGEKALV